MPQLNGGGGDDLGANDEMISFKDEGEQEEKISENSSAERDLADVKSSLVNESETNQNSSSDSEFIKSFPLLFHPAMLAAKRQDGGLFKSPPYPGYPFIMIPDLTSPYLPNGSLSPTARTESTFCCFLVSFPHPRHHQKASAVRASVMLEEFRQTGRPAVGMQQLAGAQAQECCVCSKQGPWLIHLANLRVMYECQGTLVRQGNGPLAKGINKNA
ncbi:hypothetical protein GOODEAATRI_000157 [Goodea atripinnis]|uniref:CTNNB1 binding N-teminal domain-containing protein n=1 Tax=Goodea atripinnis TaxID=208336 RepID=A0ABV0PJJ8_9TELE